jgi:hypothetical protein
MPFNPHLSSTELSYDGHEWRPSTFNDFLAELKHIIAFNEAFLFRGQRTSHRLLDSTFARNLKKQEGVSLTNHYPEKILVCAKSQHKFAHALLKQIDNVPILSQQLRALEGLFIDGHPVDLLYEYHKHM